ncbi:YafY family protein [Gorillibacterium sp. CAU 1737]|uniref:helix-turn-helix transcriptional regulator n=1 Tax=Gorillibacterium sp. CAU 1737 TaxID=3140362 RepID=UPI003260014C
MKLHRQLGILMHLLAHEKSTARDLAEQFEVSSRTIRRDMEDLSMAGIPIYSSQGAGGGIRLMEGYSLSRVLLNDSEKGLLLTLLSGLAESNEIDAGSTLSKLSALFGPREADDWLRVDLNGWGPRRANERFAVLRDAIRSRHVVELAYINTKNELDVRRVEPMALHFRGSSWYLAGWCRLRSDHRLFRLSRITDLTVLPEGFIREKNEQRQSSAAEQDGPVASAAPPVPLHLRFRPQALMRVYDLFESELIHPLENGDVELICTWPLDRWMVSILLSFGSDLTVLSPASLRKELQKEAAQIVALYATPSS